MINRKIHIINMMMIAVLVASCIGFARDDSYAADKKIKPKKPVRVMALRKSNSSITVKWTKVSGVRGYQVLRFDGKKNKFIPIKTVKGKKKTGWIKWIDKNLKENTKYTYKVRTYKLVSGKRVYSNKTRYASATTYGKTGKVVNVGRIKFDVPRVNLGIGAQSKIRVTLIPSKYSKAKNKKVINKKVRWKSSNTSIVYVDYTTGVMFAGGKSGTAKVYVIAHNGRMKSIKVTVSNYIFPSSYKNLDKMNPQVAKFLTDETINFQEIADELAFRIGRLQVAVNDKDELFTEPYYRFFITVDNQRVKDFLKRTNMVIFAGRGYVAFEYHIPREDPTLPPIRSAIITYAPIDYSEKEAAKLKLIKLAPCWYYDEASTL